MNKLSLVLATGAAHAYPPRYYDCGKAFVKIQTDKGSAPSGRRVFPTTWIIQENWEKEDRENLRPITSLAALILATGSAHAAEDTRKWVWRCSFHTHLARNRWKSTSSAASNGQMFHTVMAITPKLCHCHGVLNCPILPT
jgi:hypothetical protein